MNQQQILSQNSTIENVFSDWVKQYLDFNLFDYQKKFLLDCLVNDRVVGLFGRQMGKTTCIAIFCLYYALLKPGRRILVIAPTDRQAGELFVRLRDFANYNPIIRQMIERETQREIVLNDGSNNRSFVRALTTGDTGAGIRGQTANVIIEEEAGDIKDDIHTQVIRPMGIAQKDLKIIKIGTPFGKNHFYESAYGEKSKYILHHYDYTHGLKHKLFKPEDIEEAREESTDLIFRTEYGAEFIADSDLFFSWELVNSCTLDYPLIQEEVLV